MIAESTTPATVADLERLDHRRHRLVWSHGTPWGCLLVWPLVLITIATLLAVLVSGATGRWSVTFKTAAVTTAICGFLVAWIVGGEWLKLRTLAARRPARAAAHKPLRVLRGTASRAWIAVDVEHDKGMPYVLFEVGPDDFLAVDAAAALRLNEPEDYRRPPAESLPRDFEIVLEPDHDWPLWVRLAGTEIPLVDLLVVADRPTILPHDRPYTHPLRLRAADLSPQLRERLSA
jgi:hypothetical protein